MTKLSPAALAVMDAVVKVYPAFPDEVAAAALRAAAKPFHWTWNAEMCHKHLIAIADELEGQ